MSERGSNLAVAQSKGKDLFSLLGFQMKSGEDRTAFLEHLQIMVVIVRGAIFPTGKENANPFECQSANNRVVFLSFVGVVIQVVTGPLTTNRREAGELVEALAQELRAGTPCVNNSCPAAAPGHRRYAAEALEIARSLKTRTIRPKGHQQPRC